MKHLLLLLFALSSLYTTHAMDKEENFSIEEYTTYCACRAVAYLTINVLEEMHNENNINFPSILDIRDEEVNPYYGQTTQGILLEFYYRNPQSVLTPWGKWIFTRLSCSSDENIIPLEEHTIVSRLAQNIDITLYEEKKFISSGVYGPLYSIKRTNNYNLPTPEKQKEKLDYGQTKKKWRAMTTKYQEEIELSKK